MLQNQPLEFLEDLLSSFSIEHEDNADGTVTTWWLTNGDGFAVSVEAAQQEIAFDFEHLSRLLDQWCAASRPYARRFPDQMPALEKARYDLADELVRRDRARRDRIRDQFSVGSYPPE